MSARPFLKWAGGKTSLLPELLARTPKKINIYYESFVGGGALFFALASEEPKRFKVAVLTDLNEELVRTYVAVRDEPESVIDALRRHAKNHSEAYYYDMRSYGPPKARGDLVAARMIYLNKTCFNGLYRVNAKGGFNVPWGKRSSYAPDEDGIRAASIALRGVDVHCGDWNDERPSDRFEVDFYYFDPPYATLSDTAKFTSYTKRGFGPKDQERLAAELRRTTRARWLLSNADTPYTRKLYEGFKIESVEAPRAINSDGRKRGNAKEILVSQAAPR